MLSFKPFLFSWDAQYFHPDNMSSAEKLKLELAKVRDEFKTSEFDCGSTRVQGKAFSAFVKTEYALIISLNACFLS